MFIWAAALLLLLQSRLLPLSRHSAQAAIVNRTIDDSFGDSVTLELPVYFPPGPGTWKNQSCEECGIKPDIRQAFKLSYTAATYVPSRGKISIELSFIGTAIWVYFIFANNVTSVPGVVTGETDCRFGLDNDGAPFGYRHVPDPNAPDSFLYSQLVYFRDDLLYGPHRLEIFADGDTDTYINFDYAIYAGNDDPNVPFTVMATPDTTTEIASSTASTISTSVESSPTITSQPSPNDNSTLTYSEAGSQITPNTIAAIAGGVAGGLILCVFVLLCVKFVLRRRRRLQIGKPQPLTDMEFYPGDFSTSGPRPQIPIRPHRPEASLGTHTTLVTDTPYMPKKKRPESHYPATVSSGSIYSDNDNATAYNEMIDTFDTSRTDASISRTASSAGTVASSPFLGTSGSRKGDTKERRRILQVIHEMSNKAPPPLPARHPARGTPSSSGTGLTPLVERSFSGDQDALRQARQAEIEQRLRIIEEDVSVLGESIHRRSTPRPIVREASWMGSAAIRNSGDSGESAVIAAMGEQMRAMQEEIEWLRENQRSDWAQGLTNVPPPGYRSPWRTSSSVGGSSMSE